MKEAYTLDPSSIAQKLNVSIESGISDSDAKARLKKSGPNQLAQKAPPSALYVFISQFTNPLMLTLMVAVLASILVGDTKDSLVIALAVLINAVVGFFQEWKAERAAEALVSYEVSNCTVRRDNQKITINTKDLVEGDIVIIDAGSRVPADIRLIEAVDLKVEEALLTGESEPATKNAESLEGKKALGDQSNMLFMGTFILSGRGEGIVVGTGRNTALGNISELVAYTESSLTPIQKQLKKLSIVLCFVMVAVCFLIFLMGLISGQPFNEIVSISIALAVAAIPEGLLVAMTVILSIGMQRMAKRKALVKKLIAAEILGSVSVICTDKTGTLTEGHLSVVRVVTDQHDFFLEDRIPDDVYDALVAGSLNNDASISEDQRVGDPTEIAILQAAQKAGVNIDEKREKFKRIDEVPFTSELKYMATTHKGDTTRLIVKGAPSVILPMCGKVELESKVDEMTSSGLRVIAIAYKDGGAIDDLSGLTFMGIFGLQDALRPEAPETIKELTEAGIRTVVITGDNANTAENIATSAGINVNRIVTGVELEDISDDQLINEVDQIDVFARVNPSDKVRIVDAWQKSGHSVAMKGDGVNDAPAIRRADIGIALGEGSDLSKEIADMVLLDSNLSTISAAVREGRIIFDNIRKVIVYLLVGSFSEIFLIAGSILMQLPLPMTVIQILWINIVSDGFPAMALTMEEGEEGLMQEPPRKKEEFIINREMKIIIFMIGIITDIGLFALFWMLVKYNLELNHIQTIMFTSLTLSSLIYIFSIRSMRNFIFSENILKNKWLVISVVVSFLMQLVIIYVPSVGKFFEAVPLALYEWGFIVVISLLKIIFIELSKYFLIVRKHA